MEGWIRDLRLAWRSLSRAPGFTTVAVLTLALGIGATTAVFTVVHAVLIRPLPYREAHRLVHLVAPDDRDPRSGTSYRSFELWKAQAAAFDGMAVYYRNTGWSRVTIDAGSEPASVQAGFASAELFSVLGVPPAAGRVFTAEEEARRESVVVLSHDWAQRLGGVRDAIGRTLQVEGVPFTVIGVMPAEFQFPARDTRVWLPITVNRSWRDRPAPDGVHSRNFYMRWNVVARLRPGARLDGAQAEMSRLVAGLAQQDPDLHMGSTISVVPLTLDVAEDAGLALWILLGAVVLVLLVGCGNVANLMLARGAGREREMAVRVALGAPAGRLLRQLLVESGVLSLMAGAVGLVVAAGAIGLLVRFGPPDLPRLEQARLDGWVLAFGLAVSCLAATLSGLTPAWKAARSDASQALASSSRTSTALGRSRARRLLVVSEFATSAFLLAGAGLLVRSLLNLQAIDPGFRPEQLLTLQVRLPDRTSEDRRIAFYGELQERIAALPGVTAAGGISGLFEMDAAPILDLRAIYGRELGPSNGQPLKWTSVSGAYFGAMAVPVLKGRVFSDRDDTGSPLVAVIDESLARRYWPGQDPIGQRFKGQDARGRADDWLTVIGVVGDMRRSGLDAQPLPHVYEWSAQNRALTTDIVVRVLGDPAGMAGAVRAAVRAVDPTAIVTQVATLQQRLSEQSAGRRFETWLLTTFALAAVLLASVGVYSAVSYSVAQRTRELGIRAALGAPGRSLLTMVLRQGLSLAGLGLAVGLLAAWWSMRVLSDLLFSVESNDPATFAAVFLLLAAVGLLACLLPAWRATRVDPLVALRQE